MLLFAWSLAGSAAQAATACQDTPQGRLCVAQVDFASFAQDAWQEQQQSQWCWAASIAMIFDHAGYPVAQERLVTEVYGQVVNMPAMGHTMAQQLHRDWVDDEGHPFHALLEGVFDADAGIAQIDNPQIVRSLHEERPLVIGNRSHAMVLTAVEYFDTPQGPYITSMGVFDPWPGIGPRLLAPDEIVPITQGGSLRFLAAFQVGDGHLGLPDDPLGLQDEGLGCTSAPGPVTALLPVLAVGALLPRRRKV